MMITQRTQTTRRRVRGAMAAAVLAASVTTGIALVAAPSAEAATAGACSSTLGYNLASGGCSAPVPYQPGEDQMVLTCYSGGGFYDKYSSWHDHYSDWQETLYCGESDTTYSVSFQSR